MNKCISNPYVKTLGEANQYISGVTRRGQTNRLRLHFFEEDPPKDFSKNETFFLCSDFYTGSLRFIRIERAEYNKYFIVEATMLDSLVEPETETNLFHRKFNKIEI